MSAFHYTAINSKNEKQKGVIEADSAKQARQLLREKNVILLTLDPVYKKTPLLKLTLKHSCSMNSKELALITRQFAALIAAGLPIEEVLTAAAEQTEKASTKGLLLSVRSKVLEGHSFAMALRDFPEAFSDLYCSTIAAGEKSGHLDSVLQRLADYSEQQFQLQQKIQNALIYPALMVCISIGIVCFLLAYVVPKMITVYTNMRQTLPAITQFLISLSDGIKSDGLFILLAFMLIIYLFRRRMKNNSLFRQKIHHLLLRIPILGNTIKKINTARFARTFSILSSAGIPVLEAMSISAALVTNLTIRIALQEAANRVREGASMSSALKQTAFFPPMSIHLMASGEASGQLEAMLERAANNQEGDISRLIETTLTLFEPAIILIMGMVVLFIVLAILLPIFQLDQFTS